MESHAIITQLFSNLETKILEEVVDLLKHFSIYYLEGVIKLLVTLAQMQAVYNLSYFQQNFKNRLTFVTMRELKTL